MPSVLPRLRNSDRRCVMEAPEEEVETLDGEIKSSFGAIRIDEGILLLGGLVTEAASPR